MKNKIEFFSEGNKIHFRISGDAELERRVRAIIKRQSARTKDSFYFKRGIIDAVKSVQNDTERKYGSKHYRVVLDTGTEDGYWSKAKIVDYLHTGGAWVDNTTNALCADIYIYDGDRLCQITEFVAYNDFYTEKEWAKIVNKTACHD